MYTHACASHGFKINSGPINCCVRNLSAIGGTRGRCIKARRRIMLFRCTIEFRRSYRTSPALANSRNVVENYTGLLKCPTSTRQRGYRRLTEERNRVSPTRARLRFEDNWICKMNVETVDNQSKVQSLYSPFRRDYTRLVILLNHPRKSIQSAVFYCHLKRKKKEIITQENVLRR